MIPKALSKESKQRDVIKRMHTFNVEMSRVAKSAAHTIGTDGLEIILENLTKILAADFKDVETLDIPIEVVKQTNLFAAVTISRILWDMYKIEKVTGKRMAGIDLTDPEECGIVEETQESSTD